MRTHRHTRRKRINTVGTAGSFTVALSAASRFAAGIPERVFTGLSCARCTSHIFGSTGVEAHEYVRVFATWFLNRGKNVAEEEWRGGRRRWIRYMRSGRGEREGKRSASRDPVAEYSLRDRIVASLDLTKSNYPVRINRSPFAKRRGITAAIQRPRSIMAVLFRA